ncbi:MAG TPA: hypothetical protein VGA51_02375, partial [Casimicrobiaceae bacterium]
MSNISTRIMASHRMLGVAKKCFAIFGGNARRSQTARERVSQVMDANQRQSRVTSGALPTFVVHSANTPAAKREDSDRMKRSLCFYNRPGDVVQDNDMR